jgi:general secretion pathway protein E
MGGADATVLHNTARQQGMITLYEDGLRKVVQGMTSMEEVLRVTQDQSETDSPEVEVHEDIPTTEFMAG